MRSDFWSLPYAARQAIQRGEHEADSARRRAFTIGQLQEENKKLQAEVDRLRALIRKADEIAGESLSGCHDTAFYGEWCGEVVFSDPSLDRQGK